VKFRDEAGNTWSGRGKTPRWLADAEKAGKKREQFAV
jgi:DNA-binding protein H-NS